MLEVSPLCPTSKPNVKLQYSRWSSMAKEQTHRSMDQKREPRNRPTHIYSTDYITNIFFSQLTEGKWLFLNRLNLNLQENTN